MAAARSAGAEITEISLKDPNLPLLDGDALEKEGPPSSALTLKKLFAAHQGLLIASPEHNASFSAALKNAIGWVSRAAPGEHALASFTGKVAGLLSASTGALGGLLGLVQLRALLGSIRTIVIPEQVAAGNASKAFEADGRLKDAKQQGSVENVGKELARVVGKPYV